MTQDSRTFAYLIALAGVGFGTLFIFLGLYLWREGKEVRQTGVTVNAAILKKLRKAEGASWGGLENYFIRCSYLDAATQSREEVELKVQSKVWRSLDEGGTVKLTVIPGRPDTIRMGPLWGRKARAGIGVVMMLFGAAAILVFPFAALNHARGESKQTIPVQTPG